MALELAAQYKWRDITLSQISNIVGISLSQLISFFPSKNALVVRYYGGHHKGCSQQY